MKKTKADFVFSNVLVNDLVKKKKYFKNQNSKKILDFSHIHMEVDAYSKKNLEKSWKI